MYALGPQEIDMHFSISRPEDTGFRSDGLRDYFEYRDLGIKESTGGKAIAHVIRASGGHVPGGEWHRHDVQFQIYYVLRGWITFEYEGQGIVTATAGSCVHQPPSIRHREIAHSADLELLEVVLPGEFTTSPA
jgi:mannose-6-phosphate isomerase-like protein (cupin superfamily)